MEETLTDKNENTITMSGDSGNAIGYNINKKRRKVRILSESMEDQYRVSMEQKIRSLSRSEIDEWAKSHSTLLRTKQFSIKKEDGRNFRFSSDEDTIEHLVNDALNNTKGKLLVSDIPELPGKLDKGTYLDVAKDAKHGTNSHFHYILINVRGEDLYVTVKEKRTKKIVKTRKGVNTTYSSENVIYAVTDEDPTKKDR